MKPRRMLAVGMMATVATLAACSSGTGGFPTNSPNPGSVDPSATSPDSPSTGSGGAAAPQVSDPLDASKFIANPCSSVTASQLASISFTNYDSNRNVSAGNQLCTWGEAAGDGDSFGVTWMASPGTGLSLDYSEKSSLGYFQPTMVGNYPAVYDDFADLRARGTCTLSTGISNQLTFIVKYDSENPATKSQACQLAKQLASDVINNLGGA